MTNSVHRLRCMMGVTLALLLAPAVFAPPAISQQPPPESNPPAAPPPDLTEVEAYTNEVEVIRAEGGPFDNRLPESYFSLGTHLQDAGMHEDAIDAFQKAWHVTRVKEGLYGIDQVRFAEQILESQQALEEWADVTKTYDYLLWLYARNYAEDDPQWLPLLRRVRNWHREGASLDTSHAIVEHDYIVSRLERRAGEIITSATGDERMADCFWRPYCCTREERARTRFYCPPQLDGFYGLEDDPAAAALLFPSNRNPSAN